MVVEEFAEWFRRQGQDVVRTQSSYWHTAGPRIWQAFPYHWIIQPEEEELQRLLVKTKAIGLRFSTNWEASFGAASYHVVLDKANYSLEAVPKKARHDVLRGLEQAAFERISFERLAGEGWELRRETLDRQGRSGAETQEGWQRLCQSAEGLSGFEAWAALIDGRLAAALVAFTGEGVCCILYQQSLKTSLKAGVNNALAYVVTNQALQKPEIHTVFYGLHSLDAPASVDEFKFRMGFTARPVRQRVVFHPALAPAFNPASQAIFRGLHRLWPGNTRLAKAEGMLRFYLEGRKPLAGQSWPTILQKTMEKS